MLLLENCNKLHPSINQESMSTNEFIEMYIKLMLFIFCTR